MEMPTVDEIQRVRRAECRWHGHSWAAVEVLGKEDPVSFVCDNCGRRLRVVGDGAK